MYLTAYQERPKSTTVKLSTMSTLPPTFPLIVGPVLLSDALVYARLMCSYFGANSSPKTSHLGLAPMDHCMTTVDSALTKSGASSM